MSRLRAVELDATFDRTRRRHVRAIDSGRSVSIRVLSICATLMVFVACGGGSTPDAGAARSDTSHTTVGAVSDTGGSAPSRWVVRLDGAGPMRYGMALTEARTVLSDSLNGATGAECEQVVPGSAPAGVYLMFEQGVLKRVDVDSVGVRTERGAAVGMTEGKIKELYPAGLTVMPHKYDEMGHYLVYRSDVLADSARRLVFETDGQRVLRYRGGLVPAVEYVEGCS